MRRGLSAACALCCGLLLARAASAATSLTLEEAHRIALSNHPGIAAADYRAQAQQQVFIASRAALLPQVDIYGSSVHAGADNTRLMAGSLNNPSVFSRTAFGVGVTQLITDFGHTSNLAASSHLSAQAAESSALATREQVLLEVDRAYFGSLAAEAIVGVANQTLATRQLLLDRVSALASNKLKSELDVSFARVATAEARVLLERAQNDAAAAQAALGTALGLRQAGNFALVADAAVPAVPAGDVGELIARALSERPELASLRAEREAALRLARAQRDARLPSISAVVAAGGATSHDARLPDNYSAGGLVMSMPLFTGGLYEARQREAELRAKAAEATLHSVENNIARDVQVAWLGLNNAQERLRTSTELHSAAATALTLADARYRVGSSSIVELSQAQLALTSAAIEETGARYEVLLRAAELNFQLGIMPGAPAATGELP